MVGNLSTESDQLGFEEELAAVTRIIAFARRNAHQLQLETLTYYLDVALAAALEEMETTGSSEKDAVADDLSRSGPVH